MRKLHLYSIRELVRYAVRNNVVQSEKLGSDILWSSVAPSFAIAVGRVHERCTGGVHWRENFKSPRQVLETFSDA
jgi:hypothetical protein